MLAEIIGPDILIVLVLVLVLFGGSQLPKLARGLGSAQREFKKGLEEGHSDDDEDKAKTPKASAPKAVESSDSETESSTETD